MFGRLCIYVYFMCLLWFRRAYVDHAVEQKRQRQPRTGNLVLSSRWKIVKVMVYAFVICLFCHFIVSFHFSAFPICFVATAVMMTTMTTTVKRGDCVCVCFTFCISDFSSSFWFLFANVSVFKFILFPVCRGMAWRSWWQCRCRCCCSYIHCLRTAFFGVYSYYCYKCNFRLDAATSHSLHTYTHTSSKTLRYARARARITSVYVIRFI